MSVSNLDEVNAYCRKTQRKADRSVVERLVQKFVASNLVARSSPNLQTKACDDWSGVMAVLRNPGLSAQAPLVEGIMKVFKILMRKEVNRRSLGEHDVQALVQALGQHRTHAGTVREAANAVLNMCYEKENVFHVVGGTNCVDVLIDGLAAGNPATVQASCAGALQSISYQSTGRQHVQARGAVVAALPLLWSKNAQVRARAAGVIHNLSSHPSCVAEIRANAGVAALLTLLRDGVGDAKVVSAAAGAVQNLAREAASRLEILSFPNSVRLLGALLFRSDPQCQAFGVGALLNLFTPNLECLPPKPQKVAKAQLRNLLSDCVALGCVYDVVFRP